MPFALAEPARVARADLEELATPLFACSLYAFANGRALPELSSAPGLPGGARCDSLAALLADGASPIEARLDHYVDIKLHPFAALNSAFATTARSCARRAASRSSSRSISCSRACAGERPAGDAIRACWWWRRRAAASRSCRTT